MELMVGCPIYKRDWILEQWHDHAIVSAEKAGVQPKFLFVGSAHDVSTIDMASQWGEVVLHDQLPRDGGREWSDYRFSQMVGLRNTLLEYVRLSSPDLFLSLDSDILIHEDLIGNLIESSRKFDAVGGRCYMTQGEHCPSASMIRGNSVTRPNVEGVAPMTIIMAIKMMKPSAYKVDYEFHSSGEDYGWSLACQKRKLKLGYDGRVVSKHVLRPELRDVFDERCGF